MSILKFDEYRFHFKPTQQVSLFGQDGMAKKNAIFGDILAGDIIFTYKGRQLNFIKHDLGKNKYYIRLANVRKTKLEKNFKSEYFDNEPSCNIFIWNEPKEQKILIESDKTSFNDSQVVAKILQRALTPFLDLENLQIDIRKEIQETEFWNLVKKYEGKIKEIEFNLIYPNLPAAHKNISDELKEASKILKADESSIGFTAKDGGHLENVNEQNKYLSDLNSAASIQGAPIIIKVKDYKSKIKTGKTTKSLEISDTEITGTNIEEVKQLAEILFKLK